VTSSNSVTAAPRIAVIGGGISGLAAAHRVHELLPHAELKLFEAGPRVGGILETIERDGFLIERSADNFLTKLPQAVALCERVGIADQLISTDETRRRAFVVRNGRLAPIPEGFFLMAPRKLSSLLKSDLLTPVGKLRVLAEPFIPRGLATRTLAPSPQLPAFQDESVASFARRRFGQELLERLIQPLVGGIYSADPERLSMAATMPGFLAQERDHGSLLTAAYLRTGRFSDQSSDASGARYSLFSAPKQGIEVLTKALAVRLPPSTIQLNTPIIRISRSQDNRWRLERAGSSPAPSENDLEFDAVILTAPTHTTALLLQRHDSPLAAELAAIEYAGCAVVSLGYKREQIGHALDGFGFVVPQIENRRIIAGSFASQKFPGRAPSGSVLIRVFIGGALQPELLNSSDDELRRIAIDELGELLQITGQPHVIDIARWPRSMPLYHVGHLRRVARIEAMAARYPTLALAGNAYHGVGIPQCITSGESAAESVAASLRDADRR
jgi:oxygen-dependent protoporphyrinogen oxidase